jgi:KUP system potassium uptake protein
MAMSAFPRMTVKHTSRHNVGQVYIPEINWLLLGGAMLVVGVFKTSASIGNAYGEKHGTRQEVVG